VTVLAGANLALLATFSAIGSWYALQHYFGRTSLVMAAGTGVGITLLFSALHLLSMRSARLTLAGVLLCSSAVKITWSLVVRPVPYSDSEEFWLQATRLPQDVLLLYDTKSPGAVLYYALVQFFFGGRLVFVYVANTLVSALQVWLVYLTCRTMAVDATRAAVVAGVFAFMPSLIYFNGAVSSETPFLLFLLLALFFFARFIARPRIGLDLIAFSGAFGLAHLTRNNGLVLFSGTLAIACAALWEQHGYRFVKAVQPLLVGLVTFLCVVSPQIALNLHVDGRLSLSSTPYAPYNLLTGTSIENRGLWNQEDLLACGWLGTHPLPSFESSAKASSMAWQRIGADPLGFFLFAFTVKMDQLFRNEIYGISSNHHYFGWRSRGFDFFSKLADGYYVVLLVASTSAMCFTLLRLRRNWMILLAPASSLGVLHLFINVMPRFHVPFLPVFVLALASVLDGRRLPQGKQVQTPEAWGAPR